MRVQALINCFFQGYKKAGQVYDLKVSEEVFKTLASLNHFKRLPELVVVEEEKPIPVVITQEEVKEKPKEPKKPKVKSPKLEETICPICGKDNLKSVKKHLWHGHKIKSST